MALLSDVNNGSGHYTLPESEFHITKTLPTPAHTLEPALRPSVHLSLTIVYTALYALLFTVVYIQLWMILYYKHRRFSYQSVFLFMCLIWTSLRTTLFAFYYKNAPLAATLPIAPYWALYSLPICIQFMILCLMVLFFAQVVFKGRARFEPNRHKKRLRALVSIAVVVFVSINLSSAIVVRSQNPEEKPQEIAKLMLKIRVVVNESLFVACASILSICIYKMTKLTSSSLVLEAKGTTVCQAVSACVLIIFLFTTRAVYNIVAIFLSTMPGICYDWFNVSDQADLIDLNKGNAYITFGVVLFVWEFLPTFIVVIFFRVKRPQNSYTHLADISNNHSRAYFFDNPRRYDSEEDLPHSGLATPRPSFYDINSSSGSYQRGSTPRAGSGILGSSFPGNRASYNTVNTTAPPVIYSNERQQHKPLIYNGT